MSRLSNSLELQHLNTIKNIEDIDKSFKYLTDLEYIYHQVLEHIKEINFYDPNQEQVELYITNIKLKENEVNEKNKELLENINKIYSQKNQTVPIDLSKEVTNLELYIEKVHTSIEEMEKEYKKARTIRYDYINNVDQIQNWIHTTELKIQDRTMDPIQFKEIIQKLSIQMSDILICYDLVKVNGKIIIDKCQNDDEKFLIEKTIDQLKEQLDQIQIWLDEKKQQIGDTLESWSRFMNLYQLVMSWVGKQKQFLIEPLQLVTLHQARQRSNDYSVSWINIVYGWVRI